MLVFHDICQFLSCRLQMWALFDWLLLSVGARCKRSCCSWHISIVHLEFHLFEWRILCRCRCSGLEFLVIVFQSHSQSSSPNFFNFGRLMRWCFLSSLLMPLSRTAPPKSARDCSAYDLGTDFFTVGQLPETSTVINSFYHIDSLVLLA